jgi:hypothetical protein
MNVFLSVHFGKKLFKIVHKTPIKKIHAHKYTQLTGILLYGNYVMTLQTQSHVFNEVKIHKIMYTGSFCIACLFLHKINTLTYKMCSIASKLLSIFY